MSAQALIQRAHEAGVQLRLVDGKIKAVGTRAAVESMIEPLRQHRAELIEAMRRARPNASPDGTGTWHQLHAAYVMHHMACPICISAGHGYGLRCGTGSALWRAYMG